MMIYFGIFLLLLSFLIANNFVDINTISAKDSKEKKHYKRKAASYITFAIGLFLVIFWLLEYINVV